MEQTIAPTPAVAPTPGPVRAWSTRELAELAGTSVRTVRHYHEVGLLPEPDRRGNGYKRYGVGHLRRLLRVRRLSELGFSLAEVDRVDGPCGPPLPALRALDAELAATVERLQRVRDELAALLHGEEIDELPAPLAAVAAALGERDRAYVVVASRVLGPPAREAYAEVLGRLAGDPAHHDLDALPADADEATRGDLVARLVPWAAAVHAAHPALRTARAESHLGPRLAGQALDQALVELYNPAQVDVARRVRAALA